MARLFDDALSQYLESATCPIATTPVTLACWFYTDDTTRRHHLLSIGDTGGSNHMLSIEMRGDLAGDYIRAYTYGAGGAKTAISTAGVSGTGVWHHACAVFPDAASRFIYLNGGNVGTNTDSSATTSIDMIRIARATFALATLYWSGAIAEAAIWNVALSAEEVAIQGARFAPPSVKLSNLVAYWRLIRDEDQDRVGGYNLTPTNSPTIVPHPPIIYPAPPIFRHG